MREVERIDRILDLLKQIWNSHPDVRFNQMIDSLSWLYAKENDKHIEYSYSKFEDDKGVYFRKDNANVDLFYVEDDKFEEFLKRHLEEIKK